MNLADRLRNKLRMLKDDALAVAHTVESAFQGRDEVEDEQLDKDLRQVFYDLQDEQILEVRREEYVKDGQLLRGYFWHVKDEEVIPVAVEKVPDELEQLYARVPARAWTQRKR